MCELVTTYLTHTISNPTARLRDCGQYPWALGVRYLGETSVPSHPLILKD